MGVQSILFLKKYGIFFFCIARLPEKERLSARMLKKKRQSGVARPP